MSLTFKFDKSNENNRGIKDNHNESTNEKNVEHYNEASNVRNLHLIDASGNHYSLNYSYLMSHEFLPNENSITLFFTSHIVKIHGQNLEGLFIDFLNNRPKKIKVDDVRYKMLKNELDVFLTEVCVSKQ